MTKFGDLNGYKRKAENPHRRIKSSYNDGRVRRRIMDDIEKAGPSKGKATSIKSGISQEKRRIDKIGDEVGSLKQEDRKSVV